MDYERALKLSALKNQFTFSEAICLWLEMNSDEDDECIMSQAYGMSYGLDAAYIAHKSRHEEYNPYDTTPEVIEESLATSNRLEDTFEAYCLLRDAFKAVVNDPDQKLITRSQLGAVAGQLGEAPVFLFPDGAEEEPQEKALDGRERASLYVLIAALAKHQKLDPEDRNTTGKVAGLVHQIGLEMDEDTIRKHIKNAYKFATIKTE